MSHADPVRHLTGGRAAAVLAPATGDLAGGWAVPERARTVVDSQYVLAAAGLLAEQHPEAAGMLVGRGLRG